MARKIIEGKTEWVHLSAKDAGILKSWHPKVKVDDIKDSWVDWKVRYFLLKNWKTIWIPGFTKQETKTLGRYKARLDEIIARWQNNI